MRKNNSEAGDFPLIRAMAKGNPISYWLSSLRLRQAAVESKNRRSKNAQQFGVPVPEALVLSLTTDCPEVCSFCASADYQDDVALPGEVVVKVIKEAKDLGVFTVILAGGEPLLRPELVFQLVDSNKDMLFLLFTGGTGLTQDMAHRSRARNLFTFVGLDEERKEGYMALDTLHQEGGFFGFSAVVNEANAGRFSSYEFADVMRKKGCRAGMFFERMPVGRAAGIGYGLTAASRVRFRDAIRLLEHETGLLFRFFPEGEDDYGGCVAAGRGVLHVNAQGGVEPCPFIHLTGQENVKDHSLPDILHSSFLASIRSMAAETPVPHPCALLKEPSIGVKGQGITTGFSEIPETSKSSFSSRPY